MRLYTYVGMINCILSGAESKGTKENIKTDTKHNFPYQSISEKNHCLYILGINQYEDHMKR